MLILAFIIIIIELIPLIRKKQGKEAAVLLLLGAVTLAYGYYYNTHMYTASLVNTMFKLFNIR
jgi:hypothetical protein